jgi:hypothetical protein
MSGGAAGGGNACGGGAFIVKQFLIDAALPCSAILWGSGADGAQGGGRPAGEEFHGRCYGLLAGWGHKGRRSGAVDGEQG